jgi:hypothetical protein
MCREGFYVEISEKHNIDPLNINTFFLRKKKYLKKPKNNFGFERKISFPKEIT